MCNPLAISLLAAGAGSKVYGNYQTNKAMNNALENGVMRQGQLQGQLNDNILKGAERDFSVDNQGKSYEDAAQTRTNSIADILNQYGANVGEVENTGTGDFSTAMAKAKVKQLEDSTRLAGLMGRAGAYGDSGQKRQLNMMNDADIASGIGQDMRRSQQQTQWDLDKASQKGANANLIGDLMMMAGTLNPSLGGLGNFGKTAVGGSGANATRMFGAFA
jgi:hypothetical protein